MQPSVAGVLQADLKTLADAVSQRVVANEGHGRTVRRQEREIDRKVAIAARDDSFTFGGLRHGIRHANGALVRPVGKRIGTDVHAGYRRVVATAHKVEKKSARVPFRIARYRVGIPIGHTDRDKGACRRPTDTAAGQLTGQAARSDPRRSKVDFDWEGISSPDAGARARADSTDIIACFA